MDNETRQLLAKSKENDFYLSNLSPLGVSFNTVKGTSNEIFRRKKESRNHYGSSCPKKLLALNKEYSPKGICTASKKYQDIKLGELAQEKEHLTETQFQKKKEVITEKACLCVGLVNSAYMEHDLDIKGEKQGVVICPGPNLAFFDKEVSLNEMVQHIYGNNNIISYENRPNMLINELKLYVDYLKKDISDFTGKISNSQIKKWKVFKENLFSGITYYEELLSVSDFFKTDVNTIKQQLNDYRLLLGKIEIPES